MNYNLDLTENKKSGGYLSFLEIARYIKGDRIKVSISLIAVVINSVLSIYVPLLIGQIIDEFIANKDATNLINAILWLTFIYGIIALTSYIQIYLMGKVGQNILFKLRSAIFDKIQSLPLAFFNQNRSGDLVSRINTDTEKLNQLFSEVLVQFLGNVFIIVGIGVYMLTLNLKLGAIVLSVSFVLLIITQILSPLIQRQNKKGLEKIGDLSADVQENLNNFRVIVVFNRRNYLRENFKVVNEETFKISTRTSFLNALLQPIYDYASSLALLIVIVAGIAMMASGEITIGLFITFIAYTNDFYKPLKYMASLFSSIQASLAAWSRVTEILGLKNNLEVLKLDTKSKDEDLLEFHNVTFAYGEKVVLKDVSIELNEGKTYALVGPTGGGKSTTASLMARLYDPVSGTIFYKGRDIRTYEPEELTSEIGFILQEPILFSATIAENIKYGNPEMKDFSTSDLHKKLEELKLDKIVDRFAQGLDSEINQSGNGISLGQKQLIAFLRIILRNPRLLILDEATANIDTVTESLLQEILDAMPKETTKVIIAHRLNTINKADEIFFIADGELQRTASFDDIMSMLNKTKKSS